MGKLICPHCGTPAPFRPAFVVGKGVLVDASNEDQTRYGNVRIGAIVPHEYDSSDEAYAILVCQTCDAFFIAKKEYSADWSAVYPIQHKPVAKEIPEPIKSEFEEANLCFAIGAHEACVCMCMTALESLWRDKNASGLNDLQSQGIISSRLFDRATEVRLWARIVKHVPPPEIVTKVTKEETEELLTYLEEILHDVYVRPARFAALAQKREKLEKKN